MSKRKKNKECNKNANHHKNYRIYQKLLKKNMQFLIKIELKCLVYQNYKLLREFLKKLEKKKKLLKKLAANNLILNLLIQEFKKEDKHLP
jgi:hypothetical protein